MSIDGFSKTSFEYHNETYPVYRRGQGPGVILMHEVPGIYSKVIELATRIADEGFTVFMPHLFGTVGREPSPAYVGQQIYRLCISKEFHVLARNHSSPITNWLRALCREVYAELGGPGVGAVGLCVTGNFALSLMVEPTVMAAVLSEPALPFPISSCHKKSLHLSDAELDQVKQRVADGVPVMGLHFSNDIASPQQRFETLKKELGEGFEEIEIDSSMGNPGKNPWWAHSVLTLNLIDKEGHPTREALERVLAFLKNRLEESTLETKQRQYA